MAAFNLPDQVTLGVYGWPSRVLKWPSFCLSCTTGPSEIYIEPYSERFVVVVFVVWLFFGGCFYQKSETKTAL